MAKDFVTDFEKKILSGDYNKKNSKTEREPVPAFWKTKILNRQNNKCASGDCAKLHNGKKMQVNSLSDFDHIKPLALNGKHTLSNLQALCPTCHRNKTQEDRYNISKSKKKKETSKPKDLMKGILGNYKLPKINLRY